MGFNCGIVGLPNVGKSSLFNALTRAGIAASNYPFCTIDPHVGKVPVPDRRLDKLAEIVKPQRVVPTDIEFVDIAGLVAGAAEGEGLGNKFLANIRETDAIAHVVRCFEDENIIHVSNKINPADDIETINTELNLADLGTVEKALLRAGKNAKGGDKIAKAEVALLERVKQHLDQNLPVRTLSCDDSEKAILKNLHFLTYKPTLYIANVAENGFKNNPYLKQVEAIAAAEKAPMVAICASLEAEIMDMSDEEKIAFLSDLGLHETGLDRVIHAGYDLLQLQTYFTAGQKEVRAWTVKVGSTAPQAAGCIHSDFEKGFIRAEVIAYNDFVTYGGEQGAKEAGKWRLEGKDYIMIDGDVVHFRFNV